MKTKKGVPVLYILPALLFVAVFMYVPIIMNFYYSTFEMSAFSSNNQFVGLQNYKTLFAYDVFYSALKDNIWFALISVIVQCFFGTALAILLESRSAGKAGTLYRTIYFIPAVMSVSAVGMLWSFIYEPTIGLLNSLLRTAGLGNLASAWLGQGSTAIGSVIIMSQWQYVGYITILMVVAIQKIPADLYEASAIDGANALQRAIYITVPQVRDTLLVSIVVTVIGAFKVFTEVYTTTLGGPGQASHVLGTFLYNQGFINQKMGYASAIGSITFVITFILALVQIRLGEGKEKT